MAKKLRDMSLFYRYVLIWGSLIVMCCVFIGIAIMNSGLRELTNQMQANNRSKLALITADIDRQVDIMERCSQRLAVDSAIQPDLRRLNAFYEINIINAMGKYDGFTPVADKVFLIYEGDAHVFTSTGKLRLSVFARSRMSLENDPSLYDEISACGAFSVLTFSEYGSSSVLFVFPIRFYRFDRLYRAWACFPSSVAMISERTRNVAGNIDLFGLDFSCGDAFISFGETASDSSREYYRSVSARGVAVGLSAPIVSGQHSVFRKITIGLLFVGCVASITLVTFLSYICYIPIRRILDSFQMNGHGGGRGNEFLTINRYIGELSRQQTEIKRKLDAQRLLLARQQFTLLLQNDHIDLADDDFYFHGISYVCAVIHADDDAGSLQELCTQIEELSDDRILYLTAFMPQQDCVAGLISVGDKADEEQAVEMLTELLEMTDSDIQFGFSEPFGDVSSVFTVYRTVLSDISTRRRRTSAQVPKWYDETPLNHLLTAVKEGDEDAALMNLNTVFLQTQNFTSDPQVLSLVCNSLYLALFKLSCELHLPVNSRQFVSFSGESNIDAIHGDLVNLVSELCSLASGQEGGSANGMLSRILSYIDEHITDYGFSQDAVADYFGISSNQLYRVIRSGTGKAFKQYETETRILLAKELLEEGWSVADTGERVGYVNTSYFIKSFKKATGYTPGNYRLFTHVDEKPESE